MSKKVIYLVSVVLLLSLVTNVHAAVTWTDDTGDRLWSTAGNWSSGEVPGADDTVNIRMLPGPTIANEDIEVKIVKVGQGTAGLTVDGGTFTVNTWLQLATGASDVTFNMNGGTIVTPLVNVGAKGSVTVNMTGGTITAQSVNIANNAGAIAHVNLNGGIIITESFTMRVNEGSVGTMDITAGTLIIDGNDLATIQGYLDDPNGSWITAYDGDGTVQVDYDVTNEGQTTLKGVHKLDPNPADGALVERGVLELSWTLPEPLVQGQPVTVDVYFIDDWEALYTFADPASIQIVSKQNVTSAVVQTQPKTRYYWAVDTYIGDPNDPILGPIFSFLADNAPPSVYAGDDISTILQADGTRTGPLNGIVTDDGAIQPYTVLWTILEQPSDDNDPNDPENNVADAVIADPTAEQTTVTVSAEGTYVLQLEGDDGEYTSSDTMRINVHPDDWR